MVHVFALVVWQWKMRICVLKTTAVIKIICFDKKKIYIVKMN